MDLDFEMHVGCVRLDSQPDRARIAMNCQKSMQCGRQDVTYVTLSAQDVEKQSACRTVMMGVV